MLNSDHSYEHIAEVLLLDDTTIGRWHSMFQEKGINSLFADNYIGGVGKLTEKQREKLNRHLENNVYLTAKEICAYVRKQFRVDYTVKGMTSLLATTLCENKK